MLKDLSHSYTLLLCRLFCKRKSRHQQSIHLV